MSIIRIGVDTAKHVFQLHGVDENEQPVLRRQLRRGDIERFFGTTTCWPAVTISRASPQPPVSK